MAAGRAISAGAAGQEDRRRRSAGSGYDVVTVKAALRIRIRDPPCLFDPWIRDPGWVNNQDPDPG
jgi:hypothetical protein